MFREAYQNYKDPCFGGAEIKANGLSSPSIQQLYYLKLIKDRFGVFAPREVESVFEFGGGYGGLCRIFHHFGFQGDYRIYDIPVMLDMQRRYLGSTLINHPKVSFEDSLREWNPDLFIATFSLNESPLSLREEVREKIISKSKMVFIVFSNEFDGMDNISWSNKLKEFLSLSGFEVNVGNGLFERGPKLEISILYANKTK